VNLIFVLVATEKFANERLIVVNLLWNFQMVQAATPTLRNGLHPKKLMSK
jgi:hypothetical protein